MANYTDWQDKIGEKFELGSDNGSRQTYTVIEVDSGDNNRVVFEREDSWTFTAVNPVINDDNTIEWDYSLNGRFADEQRLQQHLNNSNSLKNLIDTGEHKYICVYNKYNEFLAEGNPEDLRKNGLWQLIDEPNAIVEKSYGGVDSAGSPLTHVILSNYPLHDRPKEQLQEQLTELLANSDFANIADDDSRNALINQFNERVNKLKMYIDMATMNELRKQAEEIGSLWYINEETGRICNVYFNPDSDARGTFVECVIQADVLLEVMEEPIELIGEPVSDYFLDFFEGASKQTNTDINTPEFKVLLNELKDDIANETYTFKGDTEETLQSILDVAKKYAESEKIQQTVKQARSHVYMKSAKHASENGEHELYSQSHGNNVSCIVDIGEAIKKHTTYGEMAGTSYVDTEKAFKEVVRKHSAERVCIMTALAVEQFYDDGRISTANKLWASEVSTPFVDWRPAINTHATIVDSFADKVRQAYTKMKSTLFAKTGHCNSAEIYEHIGKDITHEVMQKSIAQTPNTAEIKNLTEENFMNITARVTPIEDGTKLKGIATVSLGDQIDIHGVKIVQSDEKGLFLSMPGQKGTNGTFYESAIPASPEALKSLKETVLTEYERTLEFGKKEKAEKSPEQVNVKVSGFRENTRDNNIKGSCNVTIGDKTGDIMVIKGVKVIETKSGDLSIGMPSKMNADGEYTSVVTPRSPEFFAQVKAAVIENYHNRDNVIGNTSYHKLGEELSHKTLNSQFAEKVAEQLERDNVNWSGKISGEKTSIAVNKADAHKLDAAIEKTKAAIQEAKQNQSQPDNNPTNSPKRGGR